MQEWLGLPPDASAHGAAIDHMIGLVHWLMVLLFVGWGIFFVYVLVRFRKTRQPKADYVGVTSNTSTFAEVGVAVFEAVLLVGFAIPLWGSVVNEIPEEEDAVIVRVVSEQFAWNIHYPGADGVFGRSDISLITTDNPLGLDRSDPACKDDITTINQLILPVGKPVLVYLTTKDVIHSFAIPLMRVKHDAIPGERIPVWFKPVKTTKEIQQSMSRLLPVKPGSMPGTLTSFVAMEEYLDGEGTVILRSGDHITEDVYEQLREAGIKEILVSPDTPMEIACAQLCGLGHYRMRGFVNIVSEEEFDTWLEEEASYLE